jgi:hypothetical protein
MPYRSEGSVDTRECVEQAIRDLADKISEATRMGRPLDACNYASALEEATSALDNLAMADAREDDDLD